MGLASIVHRHGITFSHVTPIRIWKSVHHFINVKLLLMSVIRISYSWNIGLEQLLCRNSMSSYQKAGQPCYRKLVIYNRDLGNLDENFLIWTLQPGSQRQNFFFRKYLPFRNIAAKMANFFFCLYFVSSMRITFINKTYETYQSCDV